MIRVLWKGGGGGDGGEEGGLGCVFRGRGDSKKKKKKTGDCETHPATKGTLRIRETAHQNRLAWGGGT